MSDNEIKKALECCINKAMQKYDRYLAKLQKQIAEAVSIYPDFNFEKELENEEFKRLLGIGVTVKNAYEVIHIDEVITNDKR